MPHQCTTCDRTFPDGSKMMLSGCPDCGGNKFRYLPDGAEGGSTDDPPEPPEPPGDGGTVAETVRGAATTVRDLVGSSGPPEHRRTDSGQAVDRSPDSGARPADDSAGRTGADSPGGTADDTPGRPASESTADPGTASTQPDPGAASTRPDPGESDTDDPPVRESADPAAAGTSAGPASTGGDPGPETAPDPGRGDASHDDGPEDAAQASARSSVVSPDELPDSGAGGSPAPTASADPSAGARGSASDDEADLSELRQELNDQFESIKIVEPGQYELNLMELYDRDEYIISLMEDGRYVIEVPETWRNDREA